MMLATPRRPEIDHRTMKLIVGVVALSLAGLARLFAESPLSSISASYWELGWSHVIFIGFLFAIAAFLLAYNGRSTAEMLLSKSASMAALCVALFPCGCDGHDELVPGVHSAAAAVMFVVLAVFCYIFYRRAKAKAHTQANVRAALYLACGGVIALCILALAINGLFHDALEQWIPRVKFKGEELALIAFGVSWLNASHVLPGLNRKDERFSPLRDRNPDDNPNASPSHVQASPSIAEP
jgi:hypothetical protein